MPRCAASNGPPIWTRCPRACSGTVRSAPASTPWCRTSRAVPLVFAGACSHAPGITGRAERADAEARDACYAAFDRLRGAIEATRPEALIVVAAEHFANFFMNNMPAFAIGMAEHYDGPIEDEAWLGIRRRRIPGFRDLSERLISQVMQAVDVAYAQEWAVGHRLIVALPFPTPRLHFAGNPRHIQLPAAPPEAPPTP